MQDRDVRRRHLGVARALLAELRRVSGELGAENEAFIESTINGAQTVVPQLASWTESLLTDFASTDPHLLPGFMNLNRFLHNVSVQRESLTRARKHLAEQERFAEALESGDDITASAKFGLVLKEAGHSVELAVFTLNSSFGYAKREIAALIVALQDVEQRLTSGPFTHLPWNRT